jgi:hypothetical protein
MLMFQLVAIAAGSVLALNELMGVGMRGDDA